MSLGYDWDLNQIHTIPFVLVDANNVEVDGLGGTFTVEIMKAGGSFQASAGTKAEVSDGWYTYTNTAAEANTPGAVAIKITGLTIIQQNLVAVVKDVRPNAVDYTYTVTNSDDASPIEGVEVWITTDDHPSNNIVWTGVTDAFGIARDIHGELIRLDPGPYYFWKQKSGFIDDQSSGDLEVIA